MTLSKRARIEGKHGDFNEEGSVPTYLSLLECPPCLFTGLCEAQEGAMHLFCVQLRNSYSAVIMASDITSLFKASVKTVRTRNKGLAGGKETGNSSILSHAKNIIIF